MNVDYVCAFYARMLAKGSTNHIRTLLMIIAESLRKLGILCLFCVIFLLSSDLDGFRQTLDWHIGWIELLIDSFEMSCVFVLEFANSYVGIYFREYSVGVSAWWHRFFSYLGHNTRVSCMISRVSLKLFEFHRCIILRVFERIFDCQVALSCISCSQQVWVYRGIYVQLECLQCLVRHWKGFCGTTCKCGFRLIYFIDFQLLCLEARFNFSFGKRKFVVRLVVFGCDTRVIVAIID